MKYRVLFQSIQYFLSIWFLSLMLRPIWFKFIACSGLASLGHLQTVGGILPCHSMQGCREMLVRLFSRWWSRDSRWRASLQRRHGIVFAQTNLVCRCVGVNVGLPSWLEKEGRLISTPSLSPVFEIVFCSTSAFIAFRYLPCFTGVIVHLANHRCCYEASIRGFNLACTMFHLRLFKPEPPLLLGGGVGSPGLFHYSWIERKVSCNYTLATTDV